VILYLDSSSIVKLYAQEPGTAETKRLVAEAKKVASSRIAYAEVRAAFVRKRREGILSPADYTQALSRLRVDWPRFVVVGVTQQVVELAGDLSEAHRLRGMDAIHLASAKTLAAEVDEPVQVLTSDPRLHEAAAAEGMA